MAGATNKSAKRLGYTKAQIQTERAKGGVLSHAALLASGAPARPTKAHKALVEAMDARKQGLTRKTEPPAGWKAAARGEGAEGRAAAKSAREAFVAKRDAAVKRDALVARTAKNIGDVSRIARGMQQKQAADAQAKAAADAKQAQIGRTARALGDASKIARGMRQKKAADAQAAAPTAKATEGANPRTVKALSAVTKITAQARRDYADGHRTVAHKLSEAGWNQTGPNAIGGIVGVKGVLMVRPSRKSIGEPIPLRSILPPGAVVAIPGQGRGAVDYSRTSYYVRLTDTRPHDEPSTLLRTLASARATIRYPR